LGFGYRRSLVWSLDLKWSNFGARWLQLGISAKDVLIVITSMSVCLGFIFNY
jgi:hypothetical protein